MKKVLITGISRGIGKSLAQKFLAEGYAVIGTSQSGTVDYLPADLNGQSNEKLQVFRLDLSDPASIEKSASEISTTSTKIDILINNAGVLEDGGETRVLVDKLRETLEVNLIGTIDFTERLIPLMNGGHIVNISSQAGSLSEADILADTHEPYHYPAYKISKCALNMYTRTLAVRTHHEQTSIIVSSAHPGWVRTDMGGDAAPISPEEAAEDIFKLAISRPETGQFWYKGKKYPW